MSESIANTSSETNVAQNSLPFKTSEFAGSRVYHMSPENYAKLLPGAKKFRERFSNYVENEEMLADLRQFASKNPKSPIIAACDSTGAMCFLKSSHSVHRRN